MGEVHFRGFAQPIAQSFGKMSQTPHLRKHPQSLFDLRIPG